MFHRSEKAIRYAKELDEARLHGNFHLVPNLARKLQKHDIHRHGTQRAPLGSKELTLLGVAKSALCEKALNDLIAPLEKIQRDLALLKDGPTELVLPPEIRPEKMQDSIRSMDEALNASGTDEERQVIVNCMSKIESLSWPT